MRSQLPHAGFLEEVARRCRRAGGVFIVDEVTSGWRYGFPGALSALGLEPDLVVYAKAMSNGFPSAAVVGRGEIMEAANSSFVSSSYWTDGVGPAAAMACIRKIHRDDVTAQVNRFGVRILPKLRALAATHAALNLCWGGQPSSPAMSFDLGPLSAAARRVLIRCMLTRGIMISGQLYWMHCHTDEHADRLLDALNGSLTEITQMHQRGELETEAAVGTTTGFARLA